MVDSTRLEAVLHQAALEVAVADGGEGVVHHVAVSRVPGIQRVSFTVHWSLLSLGHDSGAVTLLRRVSQTDI